MTILSLRFIKSGYCFLFLCFPGIISFLILCQNKNKNMKKY